MSSKCLVFKERARFIRPAALPAVRTLPSRQNFRGANLRIASSTDRPYFNNSITLNYTLFLSPHSSSLNRLSPLFLRAFSSPYNTHNGLCHDFRCGRQGRRPRPEDPREAERPRAVLQIRPCRRHLLLCHPRSPHTC